MTSPPPDRQAITAQTQVWEVIYHHRHTEAVFKQYEEQTGHCICCEALFVPLGEMAAQYGLDWEALLAELRQAVEAGPA